MKKLNTNMHRDEWVAYLDGFSTKNKGRLARVELFDKRGAQDEANHLPLDRISIEMQGADAPRVEILLTDSAGSDVRHFTYAVDHVQRVTPSAGASGQENEIEIEDSQGALTILRIQS